MVSSMRRPFYTPPSDRPTRIGEFIDLVNRKHNLQIANYHDLHDFSVTRINDFWISLWQFAGIKYSTPPICAIKDNARIEQFPTFFDGACLNFAENLLYRGDDNAIAIVEMRESNQNSPERYTWKQLRDMVARFKGVFERAHVMKGDMVVVIGGNCARSVALMLASAAAGAMFASFATDVGEKALNDRILQLRPRLIIADLTYSYNGKPYDITDKVLRCYEAARRQAGSQLIGTNTPTGWPPVQSLDCLIGDETEADLTFTQVPFTTSFVVMFSSGTTGSPKGIVHSQGGLLVNGFKEHLLHNDFRPEDVHFHYSGIGWTLWNISLGALLCGSTMLLYDGAPSFPSYDGFLRAIFANGVTAFGGGPRYFSELQKRGIRPRDYAKSLRVLLSTGALLTPGTAQWLTEAFGPVPQIGFSGGTELCGSFMTGTLAMPCYAGEIAVKALGMDVAAFDANGHSLPDGEAGELVCRKPFPNMPLTLWNDPEKTRYRASYFDSFPGVWTHGDLIRIDAQTKGIYVLGRSDGVLNPSGIRFGTSELYNILSQRDFSTEVVDSIAVGQQRVTSSYSDPAERVLLFQKLSRPQSLAPLRARINRRIAQDLSKRHIPHYYFVVDDIPYNVNGKKMEIQLKAVCNRGKEALNAMKITREERSALDHFTKFYDVEQAVRASETNAKL